MDVLSVNMKKMPGKKQQGKRNSRKDVKVVYISSPMKFKTCASKFRALVQELTGKDSDAAERFMDVNDGAAGGKYSPDQEVLDDGLRQMDVVEDDHRVSVTNLLINSVQESPTSSDSAVFEPLDDGFLRSMDASFMSFFQSNFFNESSQFDFFN